MADAPSASPEPLRLLVVGGGTAALETVLAARALAGDRVVTTVLAPAGDYVDRPMTVREPFAGPPAPRVDLGTLIREMGATHVPGTVAWVEADARLAHTEDGATLGYDELVIAAGARRHHAFPAATTIDDRTLGPLLRGLVEDIELGYVHRVAFVAPQRVAWPLPLYELALQTAERAYEACASVTITLVTSEPAPLAVFGPDASGVVAAALREAGIAVRTGARARVPDGRSVVVDERETLEVDRVIALPELIGPGIRGLPLAAHGFIPVDAYGAVRGAPHVHVAGDAADFPVKHGGVAAQQADVVAAAVARAAGVEVAVRPVRPELHGMLITGRRPLHLGARVARGGGFASTTGEAARWDAPAKTDSRHLAPFLAARSEVSTGGG